MRGLAGTGLAVSVLHSSPAHADTDFRGEGGAYIGYRFGGPGAGLVWGLEARAVALDGLDRCFGSGPLPYMGSVVRLGFEDGLTPSIGVGLLGGAFLSDLSTTNAEVGVAYAFGPDSGLRLWLGADVTVSAGVLRLNYLPLQSSISPNLGVRLPPTGRNSLDCTVVGRPRRTDEGIAALPGLHIEEAGAREALGDLGEALVPLWCQRAQTEWASAPAFTELATHLAVAGAPSSLVQRSLRAAEDELRHGLASAQIVARFEGGTVHLHPQDILPRRPGQGVQALVQLAKESWTDGCLQEASAAACAAAEAQRCVDSGIQAVQRGIAPDEAEHAALAWDIVQWTLQAGGEAVHEALAGLVAADAGPAASAALGPELARYGVLSGATQHSITQQVHEAARARLARRLAQGSPRCTT